VFNGMREAAKRLRNGGRIISFASSVVGLYQPTYGVYAATKARLDQRPGAARQRRDRLIPPAPR
jgi:NAD(P)-dependent dehydrogenase (short-subunit alcohol dehydrogenase family)